MATLDDARAAQQIIRPHLHRTPLFHSATLSRLTGTDLRLKAENLQRTGSFKPRGGLNAAMHLAEDDRRRGIIAVSAGNHGAGVAFGGAIAGTQATIVVPHGATRSKVAAMEAYGARVIHVDGNRLMENMEEIREREGQVFIHPFDNPHVIAGQGTVGLEIVEDLPDVGLVVVPVGGGGLVSGVAVAVKALRPEARIVGVEPAGSNVVSRSLEAGQPLRLADRNTIADGLNAPWAGATSLGLIQSLVEDVVTVSDDEIVEAIKLILERTKLLVEPAGAAAVAALLIGRVREAAGRRTVAILSGGNVDLAALAALIAGQDQGG